MQLHRVLQDLRHLPDIPGPHGRLLRDARPPEGGARAALREGGSVTFAVGTVQGGTNAGWRIIKAAPKPWMCRCLNDGVMTLHPAYLVGCPDCGTRRPA